MAVCGVKKIITTCKLRLADTINNKVEYKQ